MRVAVTVDPELPVPPRLYGGIERVVSMLVDGLRHRGHQVTLFAHPESTADCKLVPFPGRDSRSPRDTVWNAWTLAGAVLGGGFDIVHSFSRVAYLLPLLPFAIPKLMTYQRAITPRSVRLGHRLSRGTLHFSALSPHMLADVQDLANWHLVSNGVPLASFDAVDSVPADSPLVFLGRIERIKGVHLAIAAAHAAGRKLVIAGNVPPGHEDYFAAAVEPHIDGNSVEYLGAIDDTGKNALLGRAAALLMPVLWQEPFGIVMAEALACGTPVVGLARGSVPEVVDDGVTGFVVAEPDELAGAIARIGEISRLTCRRAAEQRFSDRVVVDAYVDVYAEVIAGRSPP